MEDGISKSRGLPRIAQISILFSITIVLFILVGYRAQNREFYSGILITEFGLVMLPALIFLLVKRYDFKKVLRLNKTSFLNFFLIFCIMAFAIPVVLIFNAINLWLVNSIFGKIIVEQPPVAQSAGGLLLSILVIGGSAGLCEEFLFRGVIQRGLERLGTTKAIMIAAFLFALMHLDFQKLFGTFLLGSLIGFIVYRTNSLYGGIFAHFTNNSLVVLYGYAANKYMAFMKNTGIQVDQPQIDANNLFSVFDKMTKEQLLMIAVFYGFIFVVIITIFISLIFAFIKNTRVKAEEIQHEIAGEMQRQESLEGSRGGLLWLLPGVATVFLMYYAEVMRFKDMNSGFIEQLRRLLGV